MARRLASTVVVIHPDTGTPMSLLAGSLLPTWAEGLVHESRVVDDRQADEVASVIEPIGDSTETPSAGKPLEEMTKDELVDEARRRGVDASGRKDQLLTRLQES